MVQPLMPMEASRRRVVAGAAEIGADVAVVKEDGAAGITALDGAVEVVPLIDPADGSGGRLAALERSEGLAAGDAGEDVKDAVEEAAGVGAGDDPVGVAVDGERD